MELTFWVSSSNVLAGRRTSKLGLWGIQELTNPTRLGIKVLVGISTEADKDQNLGEVGLSVPSACRPTPHPGSTLDLRDYISQAPCVLASLWLGQWEAQGIGQWQDKRRGRGLCSCAPHTLSSHLRGTYLYPRVRDSASVESPASRFR